MFYYMLLFYLDLLFFWFLPRSFRTDFFDPTEHIQHHHYRRLTIHYQKKRRIVRTLWLVTCLLLLMFPYPPVMIVLAFFTSFLSLAVLDEAHE